MYNFNESEINPAEIKSVFKTASDLRKNPSGIRKMFKGLRKEQIDINDLQRAWKDEGFPDDTRDIERILSGHGFSSREINKTFSTVFGNDEDEENITPNPAILQIAEYAKKNGLDKDLINFLRQEYGFKESYEHRDKIVIEDIRNIFSIIIGEERLDRAKLIEMNDKIQLGRNKK